MTSLLFSRKYRINQNISLIIPTIREIVENKIDNYESIHYNILGTLLAVPSDHVTELSEEGIDFTKVDEYSFFLNMVNIIKDNDTSLIFDKSLSNLKFGTNETNNEQVLFDNQQNILIDKVFYGKLKSAISAVYLLSPNKNKNKFADNYAKELFIRKEKKINDRRKKEREDNVLSILDRYIIAIVNTFESKYTYDSIKDISIFQLTQSILAIQKNKTYTGVMSGLYHGTIDAKKIKEEKLNWI